MANDKPLLAITGMDDETFCPEKFVSVFEGHAPNAQLRLVKHIRHLNLPDSEEDIQLIIEWNN